MEKRRGSAPHLAIIDEAQFFPAYLKKFCNEVLSPALSDNQGHLVLSGTPNEAAAGYFFEKDTTEGFEHHTWSWLDNPFYVGKALANNPNLKCAEDILHEELKLTGQKITDPAVRREKFGEWVRSSDLLVYKYNREMCNYVNLPPLSQFVLGIDLGFNDSDAIICLGTSPDIREAYVVEEWKQNKLSISELAVKIKYFKEKYRPFSIQIDAGALGKKIQEELNFRYSFNIEAAEKDRKFEFIAILNSDLEQGFIKIKPDSLLAGEIEILTKDEEKLQKGIFKEDERYENHLADCFLYAWRKLYNFRYKEPPEPKTPQQILEEKIQAEKERALTRKIKRDEFGDTAVEPNRNKNFFY